MTDAEIIIALQETGLKLKKIAERAGLSVSYLTAIKRGERSFGELRREKLLQLLKGESATKSQTDTTLEQRLSRLETEVLILKTAIAALASGTKP